MSGFLIQVQFVVLNGQYIFLVWITQLIEIWPLVWHEFRLQCYTFSPLLNFPPFIDSILSSTVQSSLKLLYVACECVCMTPGLDYFFVNLATLLPPLTTVRVMGCFFLSTVQSRARQHIYRDFSAATCWRHCLSIRNAHKGFAVLNAGNTQRVPEAARWG